MQTGESGSSPPKQQYWILYLTLLVAGLLLLSDAFRVAHLYRWTAKAGIALVYSAFVLYVGKGRPLSVTSAAIVCLAAVATLLW